MPAASEKFPRPLVEIAREKAKRREQRKPKPKATDSNTETAKKDSKE